MQRHTQHNYSIFHTSFALLLAVLLFGGCLVTDKSFTRVAPGIWRGVLTLEQTIYPTRDKDSIFVIHDQFKEGELPFNFEVTYTDAENFYIDIINGTERIRCDSIRYGRNRMTARDTFNICFPEYQSYMYVEVRGGVMQGEWIVPTKKDYRIPFYAQAGKAHRFTPMKETPAADLSGNWAALFSVETDKPDAAIGEFKQSGNHLTGTFRTETGDYRYLDGTVQGRKFWMSCFDGSHAYLFSGSIKGDSLQGEFRSGHQYETLWTGWRDPNFRLRAADSIVSARSPLSFRVKTPQGRELRFPGPDFDGKVKIFTIMGTWCPNCRDEQNFLKEYYEKNPNLAEKLATVSFAFERNADTVQSNAHLVAYRQKMGIPFDIVYGGKADKADAAKFFPALSSVAAFPTIVIVDKKNQVRLIHTGFNGPATSKYAEFQQEFDQLIKALINEGS